MPDKEIIYIDVNDFGARMKKAWKGFLKENMFCDIYLSCDNKQIQAHKIILSSNSDVFLHILKENINLNPIIYLRGVKYTNLENLLILMYEGEVSIDEDHIEEFLKLAEDFKIKGFSKRNEETISTDVNFSIVKVDSKKTNFDSQTEMTPNKIKSKEYMIGVNKNFTQLLNTSDFNQNDEDIDEKCNSTLDNIVFQSNEEISKENIYSQNEIELKETSVQVENLATPDKHFYQYRNRGLIEENAGILNIYEENLSKINHFQIKTDANKMLERSSVFLELPLENGKNNDDNFDLEDTQEIYAESDGVFFNDMKIITPQKIIKNEQIQFGKCEYKAKEQSKLKIPIESIHEGRSFSCEECNFETKSNDQLKMHVDTVHNKIENIYNQKYDVNHHVNTIQAKNAVYPCNKEKIIQETIYSQNDFELKETIAQVDNFITPNDNYPHYKDKGTIEDENIVKHEQIHCGKCEYKTKEQSKLKIHIESIHERKTFACDECNFETKSTNRLKMHVDNVHRKIDHPCEQCEKVYKHKYDLNQHVNAIHSKNPAYPCKHCDHVAITIYFLKKHIAEIHDKSEHFCDPCQKKYTSRKSLCKHKVLVHDGVYYSCDTCNFRTRDKGTLKKHVQSIHEGVRYPCGQCSYKAKKKCNLQTHIINIHEKGHLKYHCEKCDFSSPFPSYLKEHIEATHDGIVHPCNQCDFKGTRKGVLKKHIDSKHKGVRYICDQCEYKGSQMSTLLTHIKNKH